MYLEVAPVIKGLHFWQAFNDRVLWWPELPVSALVAFNLQKNDLPKICALLFTLLTLSGAVWSFPIVWAYNDHFELQMSVGRQGTVQTDYNQTQRLNVISLPHISSVQLGMAEISQFEKWPLSQSSISPFLSYGSSAWQLHDNLVWHWRRIL